ncbi:ABC transporter ATP-binding protein [Actinomadura syzygii]|uniref:ABC transporter ATP-binding protein n=1 Tax=Actinomadura syzygii TaxID=1427538 RepID=A0A5D0UE02_9ACTN|nr:ABC transporter ATP-binding protein [Actinomadura syzygii]TYC15845.1 ABC transporter ATP-binding protein [Actinomadura syzygii]
MAAVTAAPPPLEATELYRFYRAGDEETKALRGVSLAVAAGEFVAVTGPSGSGKSTLLACLAGLDEPDGGTVRVGGVRISHRPQAERTALRARLIGMLFQSGNLLEHLTVRANIDLAQRLAGRPDPTWRNALLDALGLAGRGRIRPARLSGGESARAGLAVALANRPAVLLADEPTGELDRRTERRVLDLLRDQADQGTAVIVASHSPAVAAAADRTLALDSGRQA